jgi:hypothetical protein
LTLPSVEGLEVDPARRVAPHQPLGLAIGHSLARLEGARERIDGMPIRKHKRRPHLKQILSPKEKLARVRKWRGWSREFIAEVGDLMWKRQIYRDLNEVARHNDAIGQPGDFLHWIRVNYVESMAIGLRRLLDVHPASITPARLLFELIECPRTITRREHLTFYKGTLLREVGDRTFDNIAGTGSTFLRERTIRADLRRMERAGAPIRRYVNKRIAHRARQGALRRVPTFEELHDALDVLDGVVVKYHTLLTAEGYGTTSATPQFNWMTVLFEPWIPPGHALRGDG